MLWFNSLIKVGNTPVFYENAHRKCLLYVSQLLEGGTWKSSLQLSDEFDLSIMQANALISAVPKKMKESTIKSNSFHDPKFAAYMKAQSPAKFIYTELMEQKADPLDKLQDKWENRCGDCDIEKCFKDVKYISHISKYHSFQYSLLHQAVITNIQLAKWGIKANSDCTFCGEDEETYEHLFVQCPLVIKVWEAVNLMCHKIGLAGIAPTVSNILLHEQFETLFVL